MITLSIRYSPEEFLANKPPDQGIPTTCSVLAYEVGDAIKCSMNIHWGGVRGYQGEAKMGIADTVTMCRLLCAQLGLDFQEVLRDGEDRYMSRESIKETGR